MMSSQKSLFLFLVFVASLLSLSHAHKNFYVGGKDGWVLQPKEKYNDWAGRQRFRVNDTLIFKYEKGSDSVLLVHKADYYNCNRTNPVKKMEGGNSEFQFPHPGPFYFISGKEGHCEKGQKLITVVMTPKSKTPSTKPPAVSPYPSPEPSPSPKHNGPVVQPPKASSPGPVLGPSSPSPVAEPPKAPSPGPVLAPSSPSPVAEPPKASYPGPALAPLSPSPVSPYPGPAHHPGPGPAAHPPTAASPSPLSGSPQASTPSTSANPPAPPVNTSPSSGVSPSPSGAQPPSGQQTGTSTSPPGPSPSKSSATATYSSVMVLAGSVLLSMVFGSFVGGF